MDSGGSQLIIARENWRERLVSFRAWALWLAVCLLFACSLFFGRLLGIYPLVVACILAVPAVRSQRLLLAVDDTRVIIRNPWWTYRIPMSEIDEVSFRHTIGRRGWWGFPNYRTFVRRSKRRIYANATLFNSYEDQQEIVERLQRALVQRGWSPQSESVA